MKESDIRPADLFNRYLALAERDAELLLEREAEFDRIACPACDGAGSHALEKGGYRYDLCHECGSLYLNPRPGPALLSEFYAEAESVRFWATDFYRATAEARRERMFRPRAKLAATLADEAGLPPDARLADIGPGYGIFLEEARALGRFGWIGGVEPAASLAQVCRDKGFSVLEVTAEAVPPGAIEADLATAFEVLEHVVVPLEFLEGVRSTLAPGGLALMTTLTVDGFDIQVLWEKSKAVVPPHHINLLSVKGYRMLLARAGLELVSLETPGELDLDIVGNTLKQNPDLDVGRFIRALAIDSSEQTRDLFRAFLQKSFLSSHIRMIVCRPHD